jgi:hypothetical protein
MFAVNYSTQFYKQVLTSPSWITQPVILEVVEEKSLLTVQFVYIYTYEI